MSSNNFNEFLDKCKALEEALITNSDKIYLELSVYESHKTIEDEIERSLATLRGMADELKNQIPLLDNLSMSTFFPLNLPLYSLVLFAVAPLAHVEKVYVRAPEVMTDALEKLSKTINLEEIFPEIKILKCNRSTFLNIYSKTSDIILFTGRFENAKIIQSECRDALFIYNGSGVNPIVVFEDADVKLAAVKTFEMRTFNSGQDCAGPDAIFVDSKILPKFQKELEVLINNTNVGSKYGDKHIDIGPIMRRDYVLEINEYLTRNKRYLKSPLSISVEESIVRPHLLVRRIDEVESQYHEFFAPVFNLVTFDNIDNLIQEFSTDYLTSYSMYISCFGTQTKFGESCKKYARILSNQIVNDVEQGNTAYGGYGKKANFVSFEGKEVVRPLIINKEIHDFFNNMKLV